MALPPLRPPRLWTRLLRFPCSLGWRAAEEEAVSWESPSEPLDAVAISEAGAVRGRFRRFGAEPFESLTGGAEDEDSPEVREAGAICACGCSCGCCDCFECTDWRRF